MEPRVATVQVDLYWLRGEDDVCFHAFASWSAAFLGDGAAEYHDAVFSWVFEKLEPLLNFYDGLLNVLACGGGFDVAGCAVFVSKHVYGVADLFAGWNVHGDEFCCAPFFAGQHVQCLS